MSDNESLSRFYAGLKTRFLSSSRQTLTDGQKAQARDNIGAMDAGRVGTEVLAGGLNWTSGSITIPGISEWSIIGVVIMGISTMSCVMDGEASFTAANSDGANQLVACATLSIVGDVATYVRGGYTYHLGSGAHNPMLPAPITAVFGLVRK